MEQHKRLEKIICPNCGAEYLPGEIYVPNAFVGQPKFVEREGMTGRIMDSYAGEMDTYEVFNCDKCKKDFKIIAKVKFNTYPMNQVNFNDSYKTTLKKEQLFLDED